MVWTAEIDRKSFGASGVGGPFGGVGTDGAGPQLNVEQNIFEI